LRIDVHAHYYTSEFAERMAQLGSKRSDVPGGKISIDQRLDLMGEAGIDLQIVCVGAQQPYFPSASQAAAGARFANDFYRQLCDTRPGRFAAFGCVPLPHVEEAIVEAARCLDELGFPGINLACSVAGQPLDTPAFEPFWAEMDRRQAIVFLHPNMHCDAPMMDSFGLEGVAGGCFEDTIAGLRLTFSGVASRYPNFRLIIPHLGGTIPFLWQRIEDSFGRKRASGDTSSPITEPPTSILRRFYYDTVNNTPASLECTIKAVGIDHVLFGTDFPYLGHKVCSDYVEQSDLPPEHVHAIMEDNAVRLLGQRLELPSLPR